MISNSIIVEALSRLAESVFKYLTDNKTEEHENAANNLYCSEATNSVRDAKIEVIRNSTDLSSKEKINYLNSIDEQEFEHKMKCVEATDRSAEKKAESAIKVIDRIFILTLMGCAAFEVANGIQNYTGQLQIVPKSTS